MEAKEYKTMEIKLAKLEQKMEDVCVDVAGLKGENKVEHREIKDLIERFIASSDGKYASKSELSNLKKVVYGIAGALVAFLIWVFQEYLKVK